MIVVTTPTGNIGSALVKQLLSAGAAVRVIARDPAKLSPEIKSKVDVVEGSHDDEAVVTRACEGAEAFFLNIPPSMQPEDTTTFYLQFTRPTCVAVQSQGVKRVVGVSALGRGIDIDAGPVTATFIKDEVLENCGVAYRALWCPGFMDNMLRQIEPLKNQGMFFAVAKPELKVPRAATSDIAMVAARLLLDKSWTGAGGAAVLGPEDLSCDDMAAIMSDVLGKPIKFQAVSAEEHKAQLIKFGASANFARGLMDMYVAKINGLDNAEKRTAENTTPTSFRQWCQEVLKPAMMA